MGAANCRKAGTCTCHNCQYLVRHGKDKHCGVHNRGCHMTCTKPAKPIGGML